MNIRRQGALPSGPPHVGEDELLFTEAEGLLYGRGDPGIQPVVGYKSYAARLTQSGTNAPTAAILQNTLGQVPVWVRENLGEYSTDLGAGVDMTKVRAFGDHPISYPEGDQITLSTSLVGTKVWVQVRDDQGVLADGLLGAGFDHTMIEIRIYP